MSIKLNTQDYEGDRELTILWEAWLKFHAVLPEKREEQALQIYKWLSENEEMHESYIVLVPSAEQYLKGRVETCILTHSSGDFYPESLTAAFRARIWASNRRVSWIFRKKMNYIRESFSCSWGWSWENSELKDVQRLGKYPEGTLKKRFLHEPSRRLDDWILKVTSSTTHSVD